MSQRTLKDLLPGPLFGLLGMLALAGSSHAAPGTYAEKQAAWERHQQMETSSRFHGLVWRDIGPVVQGGRVVDIETDPSSPYTFYVAYASGGLWKTQNNGVTFEPLLDQAPTMILGDLAVDPLQPSHLWLGTGEANSSRSSYGGMGVYKSTDAGQTWQHTGLGDSDRISRVLIDPRNSQRVFVAALGRLYTAGGQRGIYVTENGGETWRQSLAGDEVTGFTDLVMDPSNPDVLYAAAWERSRRAWDFVEGGPGSAVWKTEDGGLTWRRLNGLPYGEFTGRIGIAVAPSAPNVVYAAIDNQAPLPEAQWDLGDRPLSPKRLRTMTKAEFLRQDPDEVEAFIRANDLDVTLDAEKLRDLIREDQLEVADLLAELDDANANLFNTDIVGLQVYRSDDGGESWALTHSEPLDAVVYSYGYYFGQIRVAPDNENQIYVLGVPVITSGDGGQTWSGMNGRDVHVDHHEIWIDPNNARRIILGNDGGLDISFDGGGSWLKLDAQPVGQFYTVNVDLAKPYNVYGGLQDNGTYKGSSRTQWQKGGRWRRINGGDGMYVAVDPRDNKTTYTGFQFGYYSRIDASGKRNDVRPRDSLGEPALRYNWNTPVILSPHNADVVYFGANRLFRSLDKGTSWQPISPDLSRSKRRGDVPFGTITTLSESPLQFGTLWAGTDDGQLHVTVDGGADWKDVRGRLPKDRWVSRVEASNHSKDRAYVSLNGYRDDEIRAWVYRTDNLGQRWTDISQGLPAEPVNVVREDPVNEDVLYVGTDRGVYVSLDRGESWESLQSGLPNVPVHDLVVHPTERELVAGTHGRSVWIVDVLPIQDLTSELRQQALHVFPVEPVKASRRWRTRASRWFDRPEDHPEIKVSVWSDTDRDVTWRVLDDRDRPVFESEQPLRAGISTLSWNLLVDSGLALEAETEALSERDGPPPNLKDTPYAEAVRLGHPMYVTPGQYTVEVLAGELDSATALSVKPPKSFEPRQPERPKLRGRGED